MAMAAMTTGMRADTLAIELAWKKTAGLSRCAKALVRARFMELVRWPA